MLRFDSLASSIAFFPVLCEEIASKRNPTGIPSLLLNGYKVKKVNKTPILIKFFIF